MICINGTDSSAGLFRKNKHLNRINIKQIFWLFLLLALTLWVWLQPLPSNQQVGNSCKLDDGFCQLSLDGVDYSLETEFQQIPLEEEVKLELRFNDGLRPEKIWVEGINMYMGKIPVIIEQQDSGWLQGLFFLGSCSEPHMRWQLIAEFKTASGVKKQVRFLFETRR